MHSSISDDLLETSFFLFRLGRVYVWHIYVWYVHVWCVCVCVIHACVCTCVCAGALSMLIRGWRLTWRLFFFSLPSFLRHVLSLNSPFFFSIKIGQPVSSRNPLVFIPNTAQHSRGWGSSQCLLFVQQTVYLLSRLPSPECLCDLYASAGNQALC